MVQTIYCQKVIEKNSTHLVFKGLRQRIIILRHVSHVLLKTLNLVRFTFSCYFAEDGKEMYQNL